MNATCGERATKLAGQLFPRWSRDLVVTTGKDANGKPTFDRSELAKLWADRINSIAERGLSWEQVEAVIRQHRAERSGIAPDLKTILEKLQHAVYGPAAVEKTREVARGDGESTTFLNHIRLQRGLPSSTPPIDCYRAYYRQTFRAAWNSSRGLMPRFLLLDAVRDLTECDPRCLSKKADEADYRAARRAAVEWVKSELPEYLRTGRVEMPQ